MFNQFISKLNPLQRTIFFGAAIVLIIVLFYFLLLVPSLSRIKQIDASIVKQEDLIREDLKFLENKDVVEKEVAVFKNYYTNDVKAEDEVIASFLKQVELLGTQSNVQLSKISPAGHDYQKDYLKYFLTVDCSGSFENVTNFIYAVNNSKDLLKVEKMNLGASRGGDNIQAGLTVSKMIIGADPSVDAKQFIKIKEEAVAEEPKK